MKNWKVTLASIFLCCVIISCSDKKTTDETEQVTDEQQITQEQLEAEREQLEAEKHQQELEVEQKKQVSKTDKKQIVEAGKPASATSTKFMKAENVSFASRGLLSNNIDIQYTVVNTSSSVSYKNVAFRAEYLDVNNAVLATKDLHHNDEIFAPNQSKAVKMLGEKVQGTEKIRIRCIKATAVQ
jgi:hypothetical protein